MAAIAAPWRTFAPVVRRLGFRSAPPRTRRWWDVALVVWMAWIFDAVNNLDAVRQHLAEHDGASVLGIERSLHLAPELALNTWLAAHHVLSEVVVFWYVNVHGAVTFAVFGWLWWRRPDLLSPLRTALFITTPIALAAFWAWPVAPPRMLTTTHYVDLVAAVHHVPVWQLGGTALDANQLAALPSLHIAWAVWAAVALWRMSSRRWLSAVAVAYPLLTLYAVMATGNHYLTDGLVGALITGLAVLGSDRWWAWRRTRPPRPSSSKLGPCAETSERSTTSSRPRPSKRSTRRRSSTSARSAASTSPRRPTPRHSSARSRP